MQYNIKRLDAWCVNGNEWWVRKSIETGNMHIYENTVVINALINMGHLHLSQSDYIAHFDNGTITILHKESGCPILKLEPMGE